MTLIAASRAEGGLVDSIIPSMRTSKIQIGHQWASTGSGKWLKPQGSWALPSTFAKQVF